MAGARRVTTRQVARLLRRCLKQGQAVEIDSLGVFARGEEGIVFRPEQRPKVFLAYGAEDAEAVDRIRAALLDAGFQPWMDRHALMPGQNWPRAIEGAIRTADFFVACLSERSVGKRGTFQSELRYALDCARSLPLDDLFFLPVRLEECSVPARISEQWQYVDLFPEFTAGMERLIAAMRREVARRRG
ncbi:MAG: TIR domain-containing protein [Acidobacteria bacterium]|nr:TIR domain-containing protein [Acidobacteriota bacterium]